MGYQKQVAKTTHTKLLDHVLIYGLALLVVCVRVCVCVCVWCACVRFCCRAFFAFEPAGQTRVTRRVKLLLGKDPASSDVSVRFRGVCQGQNLLQLH